jgi:L-xylulokinase
VANVLGEDIIAVGVAGHGDGMYLVDARGRPVRPAISSLDSRAYKLLERWSQAGILEKALRLTGQRPFAASPAALASWLREFEPESLERSRWLLFCKDWIKLKLTGEVSTDPTEASASFTDVNTQRYSGAAFELYGLEEISERIPPVVGCTEIAGKVGREAAAETGLARGTPVVSGLHDVDSSALGTGCVYSDRLCLVAGTWSINGTVSTEPVLDARWACRNFIEPGKWMHMSTSPASATNLEWFVRHLCANEVEEAAGQNLSSYDFISDEVEATLGESPQVFYLPFLYGSPHGDLATAGFFGLRGWHTRGHLLRALFEGVVFNHKVHVDALRSAFRVSEARLSGGGARSELWRQMFADALGFPVHVTNTEEAGVRGAALCAGIGAGIYGSLNEAVDRVVRVVDTYEPRSEQHEQLTRAYDVYLSAVEALSPFWRHLEQSSSPE